MNMQIVAMVAIIVVALVVVLLMGRLAHRVDKRVYIERWHKVMELAGQGEQTWIQAVMEADKLLDAALKQLGYKGKTMGERLVSANRVWADPDAVWRAHKLRNRLVHEVDVKANRKEVSSALRGFERALKDLGVI